MFSSSVLVEFKSVFDFEMEFIAGKNGMQKANK